MDALARKKRKLWVFKKLGRKKKSALKKKKAETKWILGWLTY